MSVIHPKIFAGGIMRGPVLANSSTPTGMTGTLDNPSTESIVDADHPVRTVAAHETGRMEGVASYFGPPRLQLGGPSDPSTVDDDIFIERVAADYIRRQVSRYDRLRDDHPLMQQVQALYQQLDIPNDERAEIIILPGDPKVNAAALATGQILISGGAFRHLPPYEEVWQALLAHEQIHLSKEHSKKLRDAMKDRKIPLENGLRKLAIRRLHETQADIEGGVMLLNRSGINPLGNKLLFQSFAERQSRRNNWLNVEHGSALDRALNTESVFAFYDLRALSDTLTPIGLTELERDIRRESQYADLTGHILERLPRVRREEIKAARLEFALNAGLLESLIRLNSFSEYYDKDPFTAKLYRLLDQRIDVHLMARLPRFSEDERRAFKAIVKLLIYLPKALDDELLGTCKTIGTRGLKKILQPDHWKAVPEIILKNSPDQLVEIISTLHLDERKSSPDNSQAAPEALETTWRPTITALYQQQGAYPIAAQDLEFPAVFSDHSQALVKTAEKFFGIFRELLEQEIAAIRASQHDPTKQQIPKKIASRTLADMRPMSLEDLLDVMALMNWQTATDLPIIKGFIEKKLPEPAADNEALDIIATTLAIFHQYWAELIARHYQKVLLRGTHVSPLEAFLLRFAIQSNAKVGKARFIYSSDQIDEQLRETTQSLSKTVKTKRTDSLDVKQLTIGNLNTLKKLNLDMRFVVISNDYRNRIDSSSETQSVIDLCEEITTLDKKIQQLVPGPKAPAQQMVKQLICHYLALSAGDKTALMQRWHRLEEAGWIPKYLDSEHDATFLHHFVYSALTRPTWDLTNPDESDFLLKLAPYIDSPELRLRYSTILTDHYLEEADFDEKVEKLFGREAANIRDFELQRSFIEDEVRTHDQLAAVRTTLESNLREFIDRGHAGVGGYAILDQLNADNRTKLALTQRFLETRNGDRDMKEWTFDILGEFDYKERLYYLRDRRSLLRLMQEWVGASDRVLAELYNLPFSHRYALARNLLAGPNGLLFREESKRGLLQAMVANVITKGEDQADLRATIDDVIAAISRVPDWEPLFFGIAPVIAENILLYPKKATPWRDMFCLEEAFDIPYKAPKRKRKLKLGQYKMPVAVARQAALHAVEEFLSDQQSFSVNREPMNPAALVVTIAQQLGAPGVRFLQVLGQYVTVPDEYKDAFDDIYDQVPGQNKLFADMLLEREWPDYRQEVASVDRTTGGGSIMTVFEVTMRDGSRQVLKVRNPNILYRMKMAFEFMSQIVEQLIEQDPRRYHAIAGALDDIREWIRHDIADEGFLEKDRQFRAMHHGFQPDAFDYTISVPPSFPPDNPHIKREEFVDGINLTGWNELAAQGHDMKQVISLMAQNFFSQMMTPIDESGKRRLHADIHPGNFRVDEQKRVWILDRNGYHDYDEKDIELLMGLFAAPEPAAIVAQLTDYFKDAKEDHKIQVIVTHFMEQEMPLEEKWQMIIRNLRHIGLRLPLRITLLLKNLNALNQFAKRAGFTDLGESLSYVPSAHL